MKPAKVPVRVQRVIDAVRGADPSPLLPVQGKRRDGAPLSAGAEREGCRSAERGGSHHGWRADPAWGWPVRHVPVVEGMTP